MSTDGPVKALLIAMVQDPAPTVYSLQRFTPERLCFFLPKSSMGMVESEVQPNLSKMPQKWDWIVTPDPESFGKSHQVLAESLPKLLNAWNVHPGELVIDMTMATPAMAGAMALVGLPFTSRVMRLAETSLEHVSDSNVVMIGNVPRVWTQSNPWDEEAVQIRREAAGYFNQGSYGTACRVFQRLEKRVSGGLKPLYHAYADIADGYRHWGVFHYRQAWEKLKAAVKALDLASAWGGPPGASSLLKAIKDNVRFLEQIVLDPSEVKTKLIADLLAQAKRQVEQRQDAELATRLLLRALTAFAQSRLFHSHQIKSWDVGLEQLPQSMQPHIQERYRSETDGKCQLPMLAQFKLLQELQDPFGKSFDKHWPHLKTLIDATDHAVLGQGFEPIKVERWHQLYEMVLKVTEIGEQDLPKIPSMTL